MVQIASRQDLCQNSESDDDDDLLTHMKLIENQPHDELPTFRERPIAFGTIWLDV